MLTPVKRYAIADAARFFSQAFGLDPKPALIQAGLPGDFLGAGERTVTAREFYAVWDALDALSPRGDFPLRIAELMQSKAFDSAVYSFYCSPTVRVGLDRKALFKPLIVPLRMQTQDGEGHVTSTFDSTLPDRRLPDLMGWFDLVYFLLAIRFATDEHVIPAAVEIATPRPDWPEAETFFGCPILQGDTYRLVLRKEDADRPLVSRNDALWAELEHGLLARLDQDTGAKPTAARVRQALVDGLPGGMVSADQVARTLALSKRSLQRRLSEEGAVFKDILEDTRRALALTYLRNSDLSTQEIAYLLGFRDPSSFFRAFRGWTGQTPQAVREKEI